jgi:hypothetical protein
LSFELLHIGVQVFFTQRTVYFLLFRHKLGLFKKLFIFKFWHEVFVLRALFN